MVLTSRFERLIELKPPALPGDIYSVGAPRPSLWRGRVTAFEVNHGDAIKPAFGYRIEYSGLMVLPIRN